jgi:imidazolonepropionase-like amidohydrolase
MNANFSKIIKSGFVILILIIPFMTSCRVSNHDCLITNVNVVDVKTGKILKNKTLAIDSNRISAIYDNEIVGSSSTIVIDGKGKFIIPGLWDMHSHYKWNHIDTDPLLIANGITGVREMWSDMPEYVKIPKNTPQEGVVSPDIYFAADFIDGNPPAFPGSLIVTNSDEAVIAVNNQMEKGVDFLKVYGMLTEEAFMSIAKEAKKRNISFAGHIPNSVSIYKAIEAGMASSEHFNGFLEGCIPQNRNVNPQKSMEEFISRFSEKRFDSLCTVLANSNMWLCPTLVVNRAMSYLNDSVFLNDYRMAYLPGYVIGIWNQQMNAYTKNQIDVHANSTRVRYLFEQSLIGKMNEKGVKFLAGTDFPNPYVFPGFSLQDELSLMAKGGMPALDVLKSATINPAIFMNKNADFGSVEVGKLASLVLLNKNPLENTVIVRGKVYNRKALDLMLAHAKFNAK